MQKLKVELKDKKYTVKLYGLEYELILPEVKNVSKKKVKKSGKTTVKVASKTTKKGKKESK